MITNKKNLMKMKQHTKHFLFIYMLIMSCLSFYACSDDEDKNATSVVLKTQAEVDAFSQKNLHSLIITGTNITDLSKLNIHSVDLLTIRETGVVDLQMEKLVSVNQEFTIQNNSKLQKISNLSSLTDISGEIKISYNNLLTNISGFLKLKKGTGTFTVSNNSSLGEDKKIGEEGYSYGLFPLKYLVEKEIFTGEVKLSNNHPDAATTIEEIGELYAPLESFVVDSKEAAEQLNPGKKRVLNLTLKGSEINDEVLSIIAERITTIKGDLLFEDTQIENTKGFIDQLKCEGGILFKNNNPTNGNVISSSGFSNYSIINGDFIVENSNLSFNENSDFSRVKEVKGDFIISNTSTLKNSGALASLRTIGGDFIIKGCDQLIDLSGTRVQTIGGNLVYSENAKLNGLSGFESVQLIAGDVSIEKNGDIPIYGEVNQPGWCMIKAWMELGIVKEKAKLSLTNIKGEKMDLSDISPCEPNNPKEPEIYSNYVDLVTINIEGGQEVVEKDRYLNATVKVERRDNDGKIVEVLFSADTEIKGRGNSTWGAEKKPYRLKLNKSASIKGMPKNKNWTLLANHFDKTLLRNALAFEISERMRFEYTPRSYPVDLVINGEYKGSYTLTEHVRVGKGRVDIKEADDSTIETGGYFMEIDSRGIDKGEPQVYRTKKNGVLFVIKKPEDMSDKMKSYIEGRIQEMEDIIYSSNPMIELPKKVDMKSFIDYYLLNEFAKNQDGNLRLSTFLYKKENDDKIYFGPAWDYDIAFGNAKGDSNEPGFKGEEHFISSQNWYVKEAAWYKLLFRQAEFRKLVRERWAEISRNNLQGLDRFIDSYAGRIEQSQKENFRKWDINQWHWNNPQVAGSFKGEVNYLKKWLGDRQNWLDISF